MIVFETGIVLGNICLVVKYKGEMGGFLVMPIEAKQNASGGSTSLMEVEPPKNKPENPLENFRVLEMRKKVLMERLLGATDI